MGNITLKSICIDVFSQGYEFQELWMGRVGLRKTSPWNIPVFNGLAQPMGWSANNRFYINVLSIEKRVASVSTKLGPVKSHRFVPTETNSRWTLDQWGKACFSAKKDRSNHNCFFSGFSTSNQQYTVSSGGARGGLGWAQPTRKVIEPTLKNF